MRLNRYLTAAATLLLATTLAACDEDPVDPTADDAIAITFSQEDINLVQGESTTVTVQLERLGGYTGAVELSITGLPEGATATFTPQELTGSVTTSMLQITTEADAAAGVEPFELAVNARGDGVETLSEALLLTIEESET